MPENLGRDRTELVRDFFYLVRDFLYPARYGWQFRYDLPKPVLFLLDIGSYISGP
jgi:hypothetical protein